MPARPSRKAPPPPPASRDDLAAAVKQAVRARPGMKAADLKKSLPKPLQPQAAEALAILRELAAGEDVFRHAKARVERFFDTDPIATLDRVVPALLRRGGPLAAPELKKAVEKEAPGHGDLAAEWLKGALARKVLFEHAPLPKSRAKRYSAEPDLARLLLKTFAELRRALAQTDAAGVPRERVADSLRDALGLPPSHAAAAPSTAAEPPPAAPSSIAESPAAIAGAGSPSGAADREILRTALAQLASEHPRGTLLLVHDLRARAPLDKERFDAAALALSRDGAAVLHHHDHAAALSASERAQLVTDGRGTHYIGIAPRDPT